MKLKVAFQMDPITNVDLTADTTFRLAEEAQKRGHKIFYYNPENLIYDNGRIIARGNEIKINRKVISTKYIVYSLSQVNIILTCINA